MYVDVIIFISFIIVIVFTVRDPLTEKIGNIDKWALAFTLLLILFIIYIFVRSYIYYYWVIKGISPNFIDPVFYEGFQGRKALMNQKEVFKNSQINFRKHFTELQDYDSYYIYHDLAAWEARVSLLTRRARRTIFRTES
jgi:hypothetical protein